MLNNLLSSYVFDTLEPIAKWLTISLVIAFALLCLFLVLTKAQNAKKIIKTVFIGLVFYAIILGITLLISNIFAEFNKSSLSENGLSLDVIYYVFLPLLITLVIALSFGITLFVLSKKNAVLYKKVSSFFGVILFFCVVTCIVLIYVYYSNNTKDWYKYNSTALYVGAGLLVVGAILASLLLDKKGSLKFDTKCLTIAGVCVSLSFVLSYIKLFDPPTGGSITLASLLPVMVFAYIYGVKKGLLIGFIYGILQAVQEPWIVHPAQFLLDYPIAFSFVGLAGVLNNFNVFKNLHWLRFSIGAILGVLFRFVSSVIAGIFAWEATPVVSLTLNAVILFDVILVIAVGIMLFSSKSFIHEVNKLKQPK